MTHELPRLSPITAAASHPARGNVHFPYAYLALVFVSALDLILTYIILLMGGYEVNPIANAVLQSPADFHGLILYKFVIVVSVVLICEYISRHANHAGRRLAVWAVAISAFPVVWSTLLLIDQF
ncbi:DUF5658 family protein [Algisphaera agarilytica]|uniref:ABC-type transport system involved in multi-copper enzyme maturation permease subunit n=1 Tax=Algisphaera agarilytica TaxID=1385975 RepID=A0A7X0H938_9BACT|nr:DUF5658 family protein [Algisphaera agarilytica]MBB6431554.1 ABC-type transport system involved in multi-copper enzyme maturation permease subunit [Algisphaera agarilytica]